MAVPPLPKLKAIKLTKLQALLLLGGAFVLAAGIWIGVSDRLVSEPDWNSYADAPAVIAVYGDAAPARHFLQALASSSSDTPELSSLSPRSATVFFAKAEQSGDALKIHYAGSPTPSHLRLIPRNTLATGYIRVGGHDIPFSASFDEEKAVFQVGRTYQGILGDAPTEDAGRRMMTNLSQNMLYLEKPAGASWSKTGAMKGLDLQRFQALSDFWTLPGRVELSASELRTDTVLQPFSLYYRPVGASVLPRAKFESYAKNLLADALPHPIKVQLPDGSQMQELRHDVEGVQTSQKQNQFGDVVKFSYPGQKEALYAFFAKSGEAWLTTDLSLVEAVLLGNVNSTPPADVCHKGGSSGFAVVPASFLPVHIDFKAMTVSIHNLETGMFTICGYY